MELTKPKVTLDEITKRIHAHIIEGTKRFVLIGELLTKVKEDNLWQASGCDCNSFFEWAEKEIRWKRAQTYNAMAVCAKFGHLMKADLSLCEVEPTRLIRLLPIVDTPEKAEEAIHYALTSNAKDFEDHLKSISGKKPTDICEHEYEPWLRCKTCNKFIKEAI